MNTTEHTRRLIRLAEVLHKVGLCKTTVYMLIAARKFPAPIKIGRTSVWPEIEIDEWISTVLTKRTKEVGDASV